MTIWKSSCGAWALREEKEIGAKGRGNRHILVVEEHLTVGVPVSCLPNVELREAGLSPQDLIQHRQRRRARHLTKQI